MLKPVFLLQVMCLLLGVHLGHVRSAICTSSTCEFTLTVHNARTMVYRDPHSGAAYDVELDGTALRVRENEYRQRPDDVIGRGVDVGDVITGDGRKRTVMAINSQFPGPTLEVTEGCQVVVHVTNDLVTSALTFHWHGLHQAGNVWMDGVPYVTQCPILPRQSFTYRFVATPSGTHWYHSHLGTQRLDGLSGMLIVHAQEPEMPYHLMSVSDWFPYEARNLAVVTPFNRDPERSGSGELFFQNHPKRGYTADGVEVTAVKFFSGLINGRGRFDETSYPLTHFRVTQNINFRFRVLNSAAEYAFEISIDDHTLSVIAMDGFDVQPAVVDSIILFPGERADLVVSKNPAKHVGRRSRRSGSPCGNHQHWVRAETLRVGAGRNKVPDPHPDHVLQGAWAVLEYTTLNVAESYSLGSYPCADPSSSRRICSRETPCKVFNCPFLHYPRELNKTCLTMSDVSATNPDKEVIGPQADQEDIKELFFNTGFNFGSSINGRRFSEPRAPFFQGRSGETVVPCDSAACGMNNNGTQEEGVGCLCTHIVTLEYNKTYQLVFSNLQPGSHYTGHHPMHLHGHSYSVVKVGFPVYNRTSGRILHLTPDITCPDELCAHARWTSGHAPALNLVSPPRRDTLVVPSGGYVVLRIRTTNQGPWLLHCHSETHNSEGMVMIFDVAPGHYPPPPANFPTCHDFRWSDIDFRSYMQASSRYRGDAILGWNSEKENCTSRVTLQMAMYIADVLGLAVGRLMLGTIMTSLPFLFYRRCISYRSHHTKTTGL